MIEGGHIYAKLIDSSFQSFKGEVWFDNFSEFLKQKFANRKFVQLGKKLTKNGCHWLEKMMITVFENRPKSRIQHCERSELRSRLSEKD